MGSCPDCSKQLTTFSRWRTIGDTKYCLDCAPSKLGQRREENVARLRAENSEALFVVRGVTALDYDRPASDERMLGLARFTDKGMVFVQAGVACRAQSGVLGLLFGSLLGAVFAELSSDRAEHEAWRQADARLSGVPTDSLDILDRAVQVFIYPLSEITQIKHSRGGWTMRVGKRKLRFTWTQDEDEDARVVVKQLRGLLSAYNDAVVQGLSPSSTVQQWKLLHPQLR